MADYEDEPKVVAFKRPADEAAVGPAEYDELESFKCSCGSFRFFLTRKGPECVYCGDLCKEWMENG